MDPGAAIVVDVQVEAGQPIEPAAIAGGRARRCLVFAPTATSALLLALCTFLPFGVYGGCSNSQQVISPYERQAEAIASGDVSDLIGLGIPYAFALVLGLGTLAAACFRGPRVFHWLWALYAVLIGLTCTLLLADTAAQDWSNLALREVWHQHGLALLTVFWLVNVVLATWIEAPSRFVGALVLQWVVILLIWIGLAQWLIFLERLLLGGWITAICAVLLPLGTALQLYGDPAAGRQSVRRPRTSGDHEAGNGTPQFTLAGLLTITTLCAVVLATGQVWGIEAAAFSVYATTMALLALRRRCSGRSAVERVRVRRALTAWYSLAACLLAAGGLLAV